MRIRKILGGVLNARTGRTHSVAKLENGQYAVGDVALGQVVYVHSQFKTLVAACDHWSATLPSCETRSADLGSSRQACTDI